MSVLIVYVTCKTPDEARAIARIAVEKRLAACANIFPAHASLYEWEGAVQDETETAMILKTTQDRFEALKAAIIETHSYDTPCIVAWPVTQGHAPFLGWVEAQSLPDDGKA